MHLIGLPILTASRAVGLVYWILTIFFVVKTVSLYSKCSLAISSLFTITSSTLLFFNLAGWHDVNSIPMLIAAQVYFFSKFYIQKDAQTIIYWVIPASLSFWTLYTPALLTLIFSVFLIFDLSNSKLCSNRQKILLFSLMLALIAPVLGNILHTQGSLLSRHLQYFFEGGEWQNKFTAATPPLKMYMNSTTKLLAHIYPHPNLNSFAVLAEINLGWLPFYCLAISPVLFFCIKPFKHVLILFLPFIVLTLGVILSNPHKSTWRENCLLTYCFILSSIVFCILCSRLQTFCCKFTYIAAISIVVFYQYFWMFYNLNSMATVFEKFNPLGHTATELVEKIEKQNLLTYVPIADFFGHYTQELVSNNTLIRLYIPENVKEGYFSLEDTYSVVYFKNYTKGLTFQTEIMKLKRHYKNSYQQKLLSDLIMLNLG